VERRAQRRRRREQYLDPKVQRGRRDHEPPTPLGDHDRFRVGNHGGGEQGPPPDFTPQANVTSTTCEPKATESHVFHKGFRRHSSQSNLRRPSRSDFQAV